MEIIVFGVVAAVSFLSYALWRRARAEGLTEALVEERAVLRLGVGEPSLQNLRPGDVVSHLTTDYLVEGVVSLDDDGRITRLVRIADGANVRWLVVRPGAGEPLLVREIEGLGVPMEITAPEQLIHAGAPYRLSVRTIAKVNQAGSGLREPSIERAWIYEYVGAGPHRILAVAGAGRTEAFEGEPVPLAMLDLLPGA